MESTPGRTSPPEKKNISHVDQTADAPPLAEKHAALPVAEGVEPQFKITPRLMSSFLALMLGYNGAGYSLSLVGPILNYTNNDIGPKPYYAWMSIAWTMANAVSVTVSGRLMDIFGRRYLMIFGNLLGVIGCIVAGTANSVGVVICGITIIGYGAGFQLQATACVAELVPNKYRPLATGVVAFSLIASGLFGTPIAYSLIKHATWRWSFWITLILDAMTFFLLILVYFPPTFDQKHMLDHKTKWQQLAELDYIGLVLFIGSVLSLLLGINWGGSTHPWKSGSVIAPIVVGGVGLIAFGIYEVFTPLKAALIPKPLLQDRRGFLVVLLTIFVAGMLLYSLQVLWPEEIQTMYTTDTNRIGWLGCTFAGGSVVGALILGLIISKIGHARLIYITVVALETAFVGAMAGMTPHALGGAVALTTLAGLMVGFVQLVSISMIILRCGDEYLGVAVGLAGTARLVGGAIATAIYTTVLGNKVKEVLPTKVAEAVIPLGFKQQNLAALIQALLSGSQAVLMKVPGVSPSIIGTAAEAVKNSYAEGFKLIYLISIAFGAVATLAAIGTKNIDDQLTDHLAVELNPAYGSHAEAPKEV